MKIIDFDERKLTVDEEKKRNFKIFSGTKSNLFYPFVMTIIIFDYLQQFCSAFSMNK
jgi:hypothetical protein